MVEKLCLSFFRIIYFDYMGRNVFSFDENTPVLVKKSVSGFLYKAYKEQTGSILNNKKGISLFKDNLFIKIFHINNDMGYPWDKYGISLGYPWENYIYAAYMIRLCRTFDRYIYKEKTGMKNVESNWVYRKQKISFFSV